MGDRRRGRPQRGATTTRDQHRIKYLTWSEITEIASSTSENVVEVIHSNEAGFLKVFSHAESCKKPRILRSMIKMVYMLVKSTEVELASRILGQIFCGDGNCAQFCFQVDRLVKNMPTEQQPHYMTLNQNNLQYLLEIGLFGITRIPKTMLDSFILPTIVSTVETLHHRGENVHILQKKCKELQEQFEMAREQVSWTVPSKQAVSNDEDEMKPPNDFTTIEVLPQNEDLICERRQKPFLRRNIIKGSYKGWDHYLDIQFRLLREDFIAPLREEIYEGVSEHNRQVRVYEQVHVLTPVCLFTGMGFQISFSVKRFQNMRWEHSHRLIFGSLLCLSNNDFRSGSIIFATVVKRDAQQLTKGFLMIKFEGDANGFDIDPTDEYTMVESMAYFEAYRHVLLGLQNVSLVQDTVPFKRYIVECKLNKGDLQLPLHVRTSPHVDLSNVLSVKRMEACNIDITNESTWPHYKSTCLDESQYKAFQMALRQEISIIQGPPGTGKTLIGLKLVQALLHNRIGWDPQRNSPILVVCYTNHALDQFLEDIIEVYTKDGLPPPNMVRIGGRCKSDKLAGFVLANKVREMHEDRSLPRGLHRQSRDIRNKMESQKVPFDALQQQMDRKLLPLSVLQSVISNEHYFQLSQGMPTQQNKEIEVWLKLWIPTGDDDFIAEETADNKEIPQHALNVESIPEDEFIAVDEEARILEDDRMVEGEEIFNDNPRVSEAHEVEIPQHVMNVESTPEDEFVAVNEEARILKDNGMVEGEEIIVDNAMVSEANEVAKPKKKATVHEWQTVQIRNIERSRRIKKGFQHKPMEWNDVRKIDDVRFLSDNKRWQLYHYWVSQYLKQHKLLLVRPAEWYDAACRNYSQVKEEIDCHVARGADIIGMTTTGAAKHHHILKNIHPKIVVIEEAAEVFESHIITSLSPSVQQLILIGDHKQLRPKPNHYELEKKYNFAVSLFERLINNGIPYANLRVQHRMRPDIASLICPAIYSELENGPKAIEHDTHNIGGIGKNLFFIDHTHPELQQDPNESFSHVNTHEVGFMVSLCRYLLKQDYKQSQITLLTMYRGQLIRMKHQMKRSEFEGVRVAAVDDFQGEENDIVLLSLVRSNSDGNIGFLKVENRVCVALSRARKGLYVIGNFLMLRNRDDTIWPQILSVVEEKRCIGAALPLQCQIHPENKVLAKVPEDFSKCPEGGCTRRCNFRLECGHACTRLCHPWDRGHKLYKCQNRCDRRLPCQHRCKRKCHECINGCAPCIEIVQKRLPECGHSMNIPCHEKPSKFHCSRQCQKVLKCGHRCQMLCSEPCAYQCSVIVTKCLPCGHNANVMCYQKPEDIECKVPCGALLQCLHECVGTCGRCQQGRLHIHCESKCGRTLVCGHTCISPCAAECPPCSLECSNYCTHSKCPKKCYKPCDQCAEPCEWNCKHLRCTKKCGELCNRPRCDMPCPKHLSCGHPCIGLCGDKCPELCRTCNRDEVVEIFFGTEDDPDARFVQLRDCKHIFECSGLDQWMDKVEEGNEVQFKKCPRCSKQIRTSLRYYNEIKKTHNDFEQIKKMQLRATNDVPELLRKLQEIKRKYHCKEVAVEMKKIKYLLSPASRPHYILPNFLTAIQNQLAVLPNIAKMYTDLTQMKRQSSHFGDCTVTKEMLYRELGCVKTFLMQDTLTDQQLDDIQCEMKRLDCVFRFYQLHSIIRERKVTITQQENDSLNALANKVYYSGARNNPKVSGLEKEVSDLIMYFKKKYNVEVLTEAERIEIVNAMGLSKGHWFKCPNGHFYCITECGGAMEEAKCPDCDARIGGTNHTLLADNELAPEFDGAQYPAWSDTANMENYNFDDDLYD